MTMLAFESQFLTMTWTMYTELCEYEPIARVCREKSKHSFVHVVFQIIYIMKWIEVNRVLVQCELRMGMRRNVLSFILFFFSWAFKLIATMYSSNSLRPCIICFNVLCTWCCSHGMTQLNSTQLNFTRFNASHWCDLMAKQKANHFILCKSYKNYLWHSYQCNQCNIESSNTNSCREECNH